MRMMRQPHGIFTVMLPRMKTWVSRVGIRVTKIIISTVTSYGNVTIAGRTVRLGCDRKSGYGRVVPDTACVHLSRLTFVRPSISRGLKERRCNSGFIRGIRQINHFSYRAKGDNASLDPFPKN